MSDKLILTYFPLNIKARILNLVYDSLSYPSIPASIIKVSYLISYQQNLVKNFPRPPWPSSQVPASGYFWPHTEPDVSRLTWLQPKINTLFINCVGYSSGLMYRDEIKP